MKAFEKIIISKPKYKELLGKQQALKLLKLFSEIEKGKYNKNEVHTLQLKGFKHPVHIRAIRADMQSFVNTFIDPYLDKKPYLQKMNFVIDAGANIGYTAIQFANWWPGCKITSIEPDKENYEFTLENTKLYKNITVLNAALWNKEADLSIEAGQEDGFVVREIKKRKDKISSENLTRGISVTQILKMYRQKKIDLLKMNVEGSEKEIFSENIKSWLSKTKAMLIELHDGKNPGCSKTVFAAVNQYDLAVAETAAFGILFVKGLNYRSWYTKWYREEIYEPNINKKRFPEFYLDNQTPKTMKTTFTKLFFAFIIIFSVSCCKQKIFKKINYSGTLYDHNTGLPMAGITIKLKACGLGSGDKSIYGCDGNQFDIGSSTTDANGHFSFSEKAARSNLYYVTILYNGMNYGLFPNGASESILKLHYSAIYLYH